MKEKYEFALKRLKEIEEKNNEYNELRQSARKEQLALAKEQSDLQLFVDIYRRGSATPALAQALLPQSIPSEEKVSGLKA